MNAILAAIISGLFNIAAVVLDNRLKQGNQPRGFPTSAELSGPLQQQHRAAALRIASGIGILLVDFVIVCVVVGVFNLDRTDPWWEQPFTIFVIGILPLIALGFILWGVIQFLRSL